MGAWREALRRLLLLVGVGTAIAFSLTPVPLSTTLTAPSRLWTRDRCLAEITGELSVDYE